MTKTTTSKPLKKPIKPADDDCCGGGACCPCVWDDYFAKLAAWEQAKQNSELLNRKC